jgi:hypothetical protein
MSLYRVDFIEPNTAVTFTDFFYIFPGQQKFLIQNLWAI